MPNGNKKEEKKEEKVFVIPVKKTLEKVSGVAQKPDLDRPLTPRGETKEQKAYTDDGVGYRPQNGYHVKWHETEKGSGVADRFHVKHEESGNTAYYKITEDGKLAYVVPGPNGATAGEGFYKRFKELETLDKLADSFLRSVKELKGEKDVVRKNVADEAKKAEQKGKITDDLWKQRHGLFERVSQLDAEAQKRVDLPKPRQSTVQNLAEAEARLKKEEQAADSKKRKEAPSLEERNVPPPPGPALNMGAPPPDGTRVEFVGNVKRLVKAFEPSEPAAKKLKSEPAEAGKESKSSAPVSENPKSETAGADAKAQAASNKE